MASGKQIGESISGKPIQAKLNREEVMDSHPKRREKRNVKSAWFLCLAIAVLLVPLATAPSAEAQAQVYFDGYYNLGPFVQDNALTIINAGASNGTLCAAIYAFNANQRMLSCCSCAVSVNGLLSLSVRNNLLGGSPVPTQGVIEVVSSVVSPAGPCTANTSAEIGPTAGLNVWLSHWGGNSLLAGPPPEQELAGATLTTAQLQDLVETCSNLGSYTVKTCSCPGGGV